MDWEALLQSALQSVLHFVPRLLAALVIFALSIVVSNWVGRGVHRLSQRRSLNEATERLLGRIARYAVLILGTLAALEQVDFDVTSFLAALGVVGFTIGFALQDIARNFVAGVIMLIRQPFSIGDAIKVGDYAGSVLDITTRDTVIRTWEGPVVIIPNIDVFTNAIVRYSGAERRRHRLEIGVSYDTDVPRAIEVFKATIAGTPGVLQDPEPVVYADSFGESAINLVALFWFTPGEVSFFGIKSDVIAALHQAAQENGINIPFPIRTVILEQGVNG